MNCASFAIFAAAQMLFPAADTKPEGYDGAKVRVEGGAATIIGEFHFGSLDRGTMNSGLVPCRDMKERMAKYKAYVRHALQDEHLVGVHWFFWSDMPLTGWMDGENFGNGVTTVTDTAHPEMIEATRQLARELYRQ